tara:strand:- start:107356 stop:108333 length:978 start_codon:yes stop_codon:yes gene_type:complete
MNNETHILAAWSLPLNRDNFKLKPGNISKDFASESLTWVHLDARKSESENWLKTQEAHIDEIIIEALFAEETRPRILELNKGALLILRGLNLNPGDDIEDMVSLRIWVDAKRIISVEKRSSNILEALENQLSQPKGPKNAGDFIVKLTYLLLNRIEPVLSALEEAIDDAEEKIMDNPDVKLRAAIIDSRRKAIIFRRYLSPQRDVILSLRAIEQSWLSAFNKRQLYESYDRSQRYIEELDLIRERSHMINDELSNTVSARLNKNLFLLSIITTIFLPLSFLTGLFGINVGGIPGANSTHGFWFFSLSLIALVMLTIFLFKKLRWF